MPPRPKTPPNTAPKPRTPRKPDERVTTALRLDRDLAARLKAAARERAVGVNWLMSRLLAEGMERLIPANEIRLTRPRQAPDAELVIKADTTKLDASLAEATRRVSNGIRVESGAIIEAFRRALTEPHEPVSVFRDGSPEHPFLGDAKTREAFTELGEFMEPRSFMARFMESVLDEDGDRLDNTPPILPSPDAETLAAHRFECWKCDERIIHDPRSSTGWFHADDGLLLCALTGDEDGLYKANLPHPHSMETVDVAAERMVLSRLHHRDKLLEDRLSALTGETNRRILDEARREGEAMGPTRP